MLTVEVPDKQPCHQRDDQKEDDQADHSSHLPKPFLLLKLFGIGGWQELQGWVPLMVLQRERTEYVSD